MVTVAGDFVYAKFLPSSVMILLVFLSGLLVFFFFVKDQIAYFQLKQIIVFLKCSVCVVYFIG